MADELKPCRKSTQYKALPSDKQKRRKGSRQHAEWHIVCEDGPFHCTRLMVHQMAWQASPPEVVTLTDGYYELQPSDEPKDVRYLWMGS